MQPGRSTAAFSADTSTVTSATSSFAGASASAITSPAPVVCLFPSTSRTTTSPKTCSRTACSERQPRFSCGCLESQRRPVAGFSGCGRCWSTCPSFLGLRQKAPTITRLNDRYDAALVLAELVLEAASTGASRDVTKATTFVFDMNKVFEDFVTTALGEALRPHGGELRTQVTDRKLSKHISLRPDLAWYRNGAWEAVLDVKYKPLYSDLFPNADAYQMLAYTLAFGLDKGWLIYAREPQRESVEHSIPSAEKTLVVTALDVTCEPNDLLAAVETLADRIATSAHTVVAAA